MPFVNIRTARGLLSPEQKRALHQRVSDAVVEIEGQGNPEFRRFVMVLIEEHDGTDWSIAGEPLSREAIAALAAGR